MHTIKSKKVEVLLYKSMIAIYVTNFAVFLYMIFIKKTKYKQTISWYIVFNFMPFLGLFIYIIFGRGLSLKAKNLVKIKKYRIQNYYKYLKIKNIEYATAKNSQSEFSKQIIDYVQNNYKNMYCSNNKVQIFTNGKSKIDALKKDLNSAKHTINIQYYIFANDDVGNQIMDILCKKAKQGVRVKLIYDAVGSIKTPYSFFKKLKKCGGEIGVFFPPLFNIKILNSKINYRNHRKIVVIDGKIAYTGGINIRDDHMGKNKKLSPWRDTTIKLKGKIVWDLQNIFINDWLVCEKKSNFRQFINNKYFNKQCMQHCTQIGAQLISSGPEIKNNQIQDTYLKMLNIAKKHIYIQTPYLIPDENFLKALEIATKSGVDVKIIIPQKYDKKSVYAVSLSFAEQLTRLGVEIYAYKGFMHAKTLVVDDVVCVGTCNIDNRSFALNFELSVLVYDCKFAKQNIKIFFNDLQNSTLLSGEYFAKLPVKTKIAQSFYKLFSPLF